MNAYNNDTNRNAAPQGESLKGFRAYLKNRFDHNTEVALHWAARDGEEAARQRDTAQGAANAFYAVLVSFDSMFRALPAAPSNRGEG